MIDIDKIEAAAVAATPGPWIHGSDGLKRLNNIRHYVEGTQLERDELLDDHVPALIAYGIEDVNAAHIATSNPATVLKMVSMIRERDELQFQIGDMTVALAERDAVLRQALDALECIDSPPMYVFEINKVGAAIAAIKGVLAPASCAAWVASSDQTKCPLNGKQKHHEPKNLQTAP